jgi:hypothetical protein
MAAFQADVSLEGGFGGALRAGFCQHWSDGVDGFSDPSNGKSVSAAAEYTYCKKCNSNKAQELE